MSQAQKPLQNSAQYVKGVGPRKFEILNRLGIQTIEDLLHYYPRRYEDRSNLKTISEVTVGNFETVKGEVLTFGVRKTKKRLTIFQVAVGDKTGVIYATWFNQPYLKNLFKVGDIVIFYGKVEKYTKLQINSPEFEILSDRDEATIHTGRIVPIYPLTADITQRPMRAIVNSALERYGRYLEDALPPDIKRRNKLLDLKSSVRHIHFPQSFTAQKNARRRLVFEEFFFLQLAMAHRRAKKKFNTKGISHRIEGELTERLIKLLPFELTQAQKKVIKEIQKDMSLSQPMHRLLQGDVGSGKTIVAAYSLLLTIQSGFQGALMVPTEILAEQHYFTLSELLMPLGVNVALLISSLSPSMKEKVLSEIEGGEVDIVVGTHALIQEGVEFKKLGLAVIDEQHKFGVEQRAILRQKGLSPDVLVMTATPIPRTLALTLYGDLDISTLSELPPGRKPIRTFWVGEEKRQGVYRFITQQVGDGRQAYVVYPLIETSEAIDLKACTEMYEELKEKVFPDFKVGLIHGRMKAKEKEEIMRAFKEKGIDILISTVVIEVGIDIPNASVMVVEGAERFGLAQLHQLRGRIGRGSYDSYCILLSNPRTEEGVRRLKAMVHTQDGFRIAQEDLELRGPGEFFGTRQSGLPELRIGNIISDMELLERAREEAMAAVEKDPQLACLENARLREVLEKKFQGKL